MGWGWGRGLTTKGCKDIFKMMKIFSTLTLGVVVCFTWQEKPLKIHRTVHFILFFLELYISKDKFYCLSIIVQFKKEHFTSLYRKWIWMEWGEKENRLSVAVAMSLLLQLLLQTLTIPPGAGLMGMSRWIQEGRRKLYFLSISSVLFGWEYLVSSREDSTKNQPNQKTPLLEKSN